MASTDTSGTAQTNWQQYNSILLSTAYLPNADHFKLLLSGRPVLLEAHEHFIKQSYRNRCVICSANGPLTLSIPLMKLQDKEPITHKRISYQERWQNQHWRAITSAYNSSPYFSYFGDEFRPLYEQKFEYLFDYNLRLVQTILKILRLKMDLPLTEIYHAVPENTFDARGLIHPGKNALFGYKPYYQVFAGRHGFIPNLSVIDLLFNEGLNTTAYLSA